VADAVAAAPRRSPALLVVAGVAVGAVFALPLVSIVVNVARNGPDGASVALGSAWRPLAASLALAVAVTVSTAAIGTALAFLTIRTDVPGRRLWRVLCPLPLVIPSYVGASALLAALAPGGLAASALEGLGARALPDPSGFFGAYLVLTLLSYPYVYLPVAARLSMLNPSLEESARLLGRSPAAVVRSVVLPQIGSSIAAGALLVALYTVSDFGAVQLMRFDTLTRRIYETRLIDRPTSLVLSLLLTMVALVVVVGERRASRGLVASQVARHKGALRWRLGRWRWPAAMLLVVVVGNAVIGPVSVLGFWAFRAVTNDAGIAVFDSGLGTLAPPLINTVLFGLAAAVVTMVLVFPVGFLQARFASRSGAFVGVLVVTGFAVPGLVVALALTGLVLDTPGLVGLYQTFPLLLLAYSLHFGAQALRSTTVAVSGVPPRLTEAARLLGAGPLRRLLTVELPVMRPTLLAGAGLVMLSTMKELPASLLLAPTGTETLATRIWAASEGMYLGEVGVTSIVLLSISGLLTWLLIVRPAPA